VGQKIFFQTALLGELYTSFLELSSPFSKISIVVCHFFFFRKFAFRSANPQPTA